MKPLQTPGGEPAGRPSHQEILRLMRADRRREARRQRKAMRLLPEVVASLEAANAALLRCRDLAIKAGLDWIGFKRTQDVECINGALRLTREYLRNGRVP